MEGSNHRALSHGRNPISDQVFAQWSNSSQEENATCQNQLDELKNLKSQEQCSSEVELMQHDSCGESQQQQVSCSKEHSQLLVEQKDDQLKQLADPIHSQVSQRSGASISENNSISFSENDRTQHMENHQYSKLQKMDNQQAAAVGPTNNPINRNKMVQFGTLLPMIIPQIDKDRAMKLRTLYSKLKVHEIHKDDFMRLVRNLVGDQMIRLAVNKLKLASQEQAKAQVAQNSQSGPSQIQLDATFPTTENNAHYSRETDNQSDLHGNHMSQTLSASMSTVSQEAELSTIPLRGLSTQQQQHVHLPQTSFPIYGATISNCHPNEYSGAAISGSNTPIKPQSQDSQLRQVSLHQGMVSTQSGGTSQPVNLMSVPKYEMKNSMNEAKRLHSGSLPHLTTQSTLQGNTASSGTNSVSGYMATQLDTMVPMRTLVPSATTPLVTGTNVRTLPKKPSVGQKKPLDMLGIQSPIASKKQKVTGTFLEQSIEQLNDITAVSGVNLREEEEQLLSGPKEENQALESTKRVVQEEEERSILQKNPLQKKLAKIMSNCGIKNVSNDVERCLSLCVEERMRVLISNLIRLSKQRIDVEGLRHRTLITSDVRRQILMMNRKAKEDWEKKQAEEAEELRKLNEAEGSTGADGEDKDEGRLKTPKVNKEEDDRMRTTAANVAARVAVGGDDMLSKWQLMAEQARQKREGRIDVTSSTPLGKDASRKPLSNSVRATRDNQDTESRGPSGSAAAVSGSVRKFGRNQVAMPPAKITRSISIKDLIAVLEKESQMSKSTLLYRLYERMHTDAAAD